MESCGSQGRRDGDLAQGRFQTTCDRAHRVSSKSTAQLRLHTEQVDEQPSVGLAELDPLCRAFETATGWQLRYEASPVGLGETWATPLDPGGKTAGRLALVPDTEVKDDLAGKAACRTSNGQPDARP